MSDKPNGATDSVDEAPKIDANEEENYWRENFASRPYARSDNHFEEFSHAYRYGWESFARHVGRKYEDVETDLERDWDQVKGASRLKWEQARQAVSDAWERAAKKYQ